MCGPVGAGTLAGAALGQTVLAKAAMVAGMDWDSSSAHSAAYDAERTADLFCAVCNRFQPLYESAQVRLAAAGPDTEPVNPLIEPSPEG